MATMKYNTFKMTKSEGTRASRNLRMRTMEKGHRNKIPREVLNDVYDGVTIIRSMITPWHVRASKVVF